MEQTRFNTELIKNELYNKLNIKPEYIKVQYGNTSIFKDNLFIEVNYNKECDYPHNQLLNAIMFKFDNIDNKMDLLWFPHCNLSPYDKANEYKHYAMRSVKDLGKECKVNFRKFDMKDEKNIVEKLAKYLNNIMEVIQVYTGGYPYKDGILETSLKEAFEK